MGHQDIDFNDVARRITALPDLVKPGDYARIYQLMYDLRDLPFPPGYLDELRSDMLAVLQRGRRVTTYVYLSFYGQERASHMKIGIAKSVRNRMSGIKTGNPLPRLWTYVASFSSREDAAAVETALLQHMAADKAHGEWVHVQGLSEHAALAVVQSLSEVAVCAHGRPIQFDRQEM